MAATHCHSPPLACSTTTGPGRPHLMLPAPASPSGRHTLAPPRQSPQGRSLQQCSAAQDRHTHAAPCASRRAILAAAPLVANIAFSVASGQAALLPSLPGADLEELEAQAFTAYSNRDFQDAVNLMTQIIDQDPRNPRWLEMRAQVLVDGKNFDVAIRDYDEAGRLTSEEDLLTRARLLSGRGLACEGLARWEEALQDYTAALELAARGGESPDPFVINSRGNCYNSLGRWAEARADYLTAAQLFQQARGFRGRNGSTTARLDGSIYAASNAALMLVQMGADAGPSEGAQEVEQATREMVRIARRAPGSVDMRAALAAMWWANGEPKQAEEAWEFACTQINTGCVKYQDQDWLVRIRRWPPAMAQLLEDFLALRTRPGGAIGAVVAQPM